MAFAGVAAEVAAMTATVAAAISALGIGGADRRKLARQQGAAREQQAESSYGEQGMFLGIRNFWLIKCQRCKEENLSQRII